MEKKLIWTPVSIVIAAFILGAFYFSSEVYKQQSIKETQQAEQTAQLAKQKQIELYDCIAQVDNKYASMIEAAQGTPEVAKYWNGITPEQQSEIDNCNKRYQ